MKLCVIIIAIFVFCHDARGTGVGDDYRIEDSKVTHGHEINVSNAEIDAHAKYRVVGFVGSAEQAARGSFVKKVLETCAGKCKVVSVLGGTKIVFEDDWSFIVAADIGCVEIKTPPMTASQYQKEARIQKYIYDLIDEMGFQYKSNFGTIDQVLHFNIGVRSAFGDSGNDLIRFIADYSNRPALAMGGLGKDFSNAPPLIFLENKQLDAFTKVVKSANRRRMNMAQAGNAMNYDVYTTTPDFKTNLGTDERTVGMSGRKFQAIGVRMVDDKELAHGDVPMEFRAIRQPKSAAEMALLTEMFDRRVAYIKKQAATGSEIYFRKLRPRDLVSKTIKVGDDAVGMAVELQTFLQEMGQDWKKYQSLFTPDVVEAFKSGLPEKILAGKIDWANEREMAYFQECVAEKFYLSDWTKAHVTELLDSGKIPKEKVVAILQAIHLDAVGDAAHVKQVAAFASELKNPSIREAPELAALFKQPKCGFWSLFKSAFRSK